MNIYVLWCVTVGVYLMVFWWVTLYCILNGVCGQCVFNGFLVGDIVLYIEWCVPVSVYLMVFGG